MLSSIRGVLSLDLGSPTAPDPNSRLHSRPPRQRLPSSLVIESASASTSSRVWTACAEALPMNASDQAGPIPLVGIRAERMKNDAGAVLEPVPEPIGADELDGYVRPHPSKTRCARASRHTASAQPTRGPRLRGASRALGEEPACEPGNSQIRMVPMTQTIYESARHRACHARARLTKTCRPPAAS